MISKLDHEVDISGANKLQKAQYLIQKDWLKKKVGSLEIVLTQGKCELIVN
jgi:hypothetical protein